MAITKLPNGPLTRIRSSLGTYDGVFLSVAKHMLQLAEIDAIRRMTTGELARVLGTSRATIVRFAQNLGYTGFPELRTALIQELGTICNTPFGASLPPAATRVADMTRQSIDDTLSNLDPEGFEAAVQAICSAPVVYWFGIGDSAALACIGAYKLTRASRRTQVVSDIGSMRGVSKAAGMGDAIVVISQSGRWRNVAEALAAFTDRGVSVIVITSQVNSVLAKAADITLLTACRDITLGVGVYTFQAPVEMLIDMLVVESTARLGNTLLSWLP